MGGHKFQPWIVKGKKEKKGKLSAGNGRGGGGGKWGLTSTRYTEAYPLTDSSKHTSESLLTKNTFLSIFVFFSYLTCDSVEQWFEN